MMNKSVDGMQRKIAYYRQVYLIDHAPTNSDHFFKSDVSTTRAVA